MLDIFIGVIATVASTIIISLFGMLIISPYKNHQEIFKKILRLIRNYEEPRKYQAQFITETLILSCIQKQLNNIEEILDLIDEQKDLNPFLYTIFKYEDIKSHLNTLFEYIRNPIMLKESKEFDDKYLLDTQKFFKHLKQKARFPWIKFAVIISILLLLFITILVLTFKYTLGKTS